MLLALALSACGSSVGTQARALEATAILLDTAGGIVEEASYEDALATCPSLIAPPECLEPVRLRWVDADLAFDSVRLALGAWYVAIVAQERLGAGLDPGGLVRLAREVVAAYAEAVRVLALHGVELPALPEPVRILFESPPK